MYLPSNYRKMNGEKADLRDVDETIKIEEEQSFAGDEAEVKMQKSLVQRATRIQEHEFVGDVARRQLNQHSGVAI